MNKKLTILSIATATILFSGCGGGGGGGYTPVSTNKTSIKGSVIDPEIEGASVSITCGQSIYDAETQTDENGNFTVNIPSGKNLTGCTIKSVGGVDSGDDLSGITLQTPYNLYNQNSGILITPFTTAVAMHNSAATDIETAKEQVANFYGITKEDIKKNPTSDGNINLQRIAKKMTKLAIKKNTQGKKLGYIDIDDGTNQTSFSDYITNDFDSNSNISDDEKAKRTREFASIESSQNSEAIAKNSVIDQVYYDLQEAYNKKYDSNSDTNILNLAKAIAEANKEIKNNKTKYKKVSSFQLKKAFLDLNIIPAFESNGDLETTLASTLNQSESDFNNYINGKTIDIKNVQNLVIYDASSTVKTLQNSKERREYYAFSNISNLAKAVEITKNTFNDAVNDPVNTQVSIGLANLGLEKEALENMKDNVYTRSQKIKGYKELGSAFTRVDLKESAIEAYYRNYQNKILEISSLGESNVKSTNITDLMATARSIGLNATSDNDQAKIDEIINKILSYSKVSTQAAMYQKYLQGLSNYAQALYVESNNISEAKKQAIKAAEESLKTPTDKTSSAISNILRATLSSAIFNDTKYANEVLTNTSSIDTTSRYIGKGSATYQYYYPIIIGLTGDYVVAKAAYDELSSSKKDDSINNGFAAVMILNNQMDDLFTNELIPSRYRAGIDFLFNFMLPEASETRFSIAQILYLRNETTKLEEFLDKLRTLITRDDWKNDATQSDLSALYSKWSLKSALTRGSYVTIANWYKKLNNNTKAKATILEAISGINDLTEISNKIDAYDNLFTGLNDTKLIDLLTQSEIENILNSFKSTANHADMNDIEDIVKTANWFSYFSKKDEAKTLVLRAYGLIESKNLGNLTSVKNRIKYLVEKDNSIAEGYSQASDDEKARDIIKEALEDANSLDQKSTDYDEVLVHISNAYARINDYKKAAEIISKIKTDKEIDTAKVEAAEYLANYDKFKNSDIASVDSDNDGKPDFWNTNASSDDIARSNLTLDDDIDNDGIQEPNDTLPYNGVL